MIPDRITGQPHQDGPPTKGHHATAQADRKGRPYYTRPISAQVAR